MFKVPPYYNCLDPMIRTAVRCTE